MDIDEFNDKYTGTLKLKFSEPIERWSRSTTLVSVRFVPETYDGADFDLAVKPIELRQPVLACSRLVLKSDRGRTTDHCSPHDEPCFTVGDLFAAIERHEMIVRSQLDWFDMDHVYFEGLSDDGDGTYRISWGS